MLTKELRDYYDNQFDMMATKGWKDFCEDLKTIRVPLSDMTTATVENLQNRQGRLAELDFILNRRQQLSDAFEELQNETPV